MNCIKCGREIPEGELFCSVCSMPPAPPEPPGGRKPQKAADPKGRPESRPQAQKARSDKPPRRRGLVAALIIVSLLLAGAVACIALGYGNMMQERRRLRAKEADLIYRENVLAEQQQDMEQLNQELERARDSIQSLEQEIEALEDQLHDSESSVSQSQYDMTSQQQEMDLLSDENATLLEEVTALERQAETLRGQVERLTAANDANSAKATFLDTYVVFVNNDGSDVYHTYDCPQFTRQSFWAYSRKLAESYGYTPCPSCCG